MTMVRKVTISISAELDAAIHLAALEQGSNRSRIIETYLRESPTVQEYIREIRNEPDVPVLAWSSRKPARNVPPTSTARPRKRVKRAPSASR